MKHNGDDKKTAILEAAFEVVADKGYFQTTVADVARKAGVAKGTVYLYFKDKPEIYIGLVDWLFEQAVANIREVDAEPLSARDKLARILTDWSEYVLARPGAMSLLSFEDPKTHIAARAEERLHATVLARMKEMVGGLSSIIKQGIAAGEFRDVNPVMAALMFGMAFRMSVMVVQQELGVEHPQEVASDILFQGLLAPATTATQPRG